MKTVQRQWREWYEQSEFQRELDTETLVLNANTREINLSASGKYISALELTFTGALVATAAENPIAGATALQIFLDDLRIKGPGKMVELFYVSDNVARHAHRSFLDEDILETIPVFGGGGNANLQSTIIVPVSIDMSKGYNTLTVDARLGNIVELYAADVTIGVSTMRVNIISTDTSPTVDFSLQSQTLQLPVAGRSNVTTLYQGYPRASISFLGELATEYDTIEYQLPSGRTVINADYQQIREQFLFKFDPAIDDTAVSNIRGETLIQTSYRSANGTIEAWHDGGVFNVQTVTGGGAVKNPNVLEVLLRTMLPQSEAPTATGAPPVSAAGPGAPSGGGMRVGSGPVAGGKY